MGGIWTYVKQLADRLIALGVEVDIMGQMAPITKYMFVI